MDCPFARIACCVDRDEMAPRIIEEALRLAGGEGARLHVVHVVAPPGMLAASPFAYVPPVMESTKEAAGWLREITSGIPDVTTVLLDGPPARALCDWAVGSGADLIVAAAYRSRVERAVLGGFASHVAYRAPCPVLLVHHPIDEALPLIDADAEAGAIAGR